MAIKKETLITYKRDKDKVEISGAPKDVKSLIWFDMISSRLKGTLWGGVLLFSVPKASILPLLWQWIKRQMPFMMLFVVTAAWLQMLFSG